MKTTLELPDELLARLEIRAAREGRDMRELAEGLLIAALQASSDEGGELVPKRLPLIKARPAAPSNASSMTAQEAADWIKELDQQDDMERFERAFGHQYVDRAES